MAYINQEIRNPRTGQRMTFVEMKEELLRIDSFSPPTEEREPLHVHPEQRSGAELLSGSLIFEVDGVWRRLSPGESISIPADTPHGRTGDPAGEPTLALTAGADYRPCSDRKGARSPRQARLRADPGKQLGP